MNQAELINAVKAKKGFVRIIKDELAPDAIPTDKTQKRLLTIEHSNGDNTAGITYVYYLHDTENDVAKFYNVEPENLDNTELSLDLKKEHALKQYLGGKYAAYFIERTDYVNNWAEATVYVLAASKLTKKQVLVFKKGTSPISDLDIVTV